MNTSSSPVSDWRSLSDRLTPAQVRHLEAAERLGREGLASEEAHARASGQELLDGLLHEAMFCASHNIEPGLEPPGGTDLAVFRRLVRTVDVRQLDKFDRLAVVSLLERALSVEGGGGNDGRLS